MMIKKPIGATLPVFVNFQEPVLLVEVIEGPDGLPDLRLQQNTRHYIDLSISDLQAILNWASSP